MSIEAMRKIHWSTPVNRPLTWLSARDVQRSPELSGMAGAPVYRPKGTTELPWAYVLSDIRVPFLVRVFFGSETTGQAGSAWVQDDICFFGCVLWTHRRLLGMS
jgi:hypothetical protein